MFDGNKNNGQEEIVNDSELKAVREETVTDLDVREVQGENVVEMEPGYGQEETVVETGGDFAGETMRTDGEINAVQEESMTDIEAGEGQEEQIVDAKAEEIQEDRAGNAGSETSFVSDAQAGNKVESEEAQNSQDHQYRYGRSYYQNQQDSVYHTNGAGNQENNQNQGNMYHYSNGYAQSTNQSQGYQAGGMNQGGAGNAGGMNMHNNINQGYTQAGNGSVHQNYQAGPFANQAQQQPKKKKSDGHTFKKVLKMAACVVIMAAVGAGSAVGTTMWLDARNEGRTENSSVTAGNRKNNTVPVSTISANTAVVTDVSNVVENTMPSVVKITNVGTQTYNGFFGGTYEYESNGSGIIIGQTEEELLVVTNQHVVAGANTLQVIFIDETSCEANVKGTDAEKDLAVIAVPIKSLKEDTLNKIKVATMGDSESVKVGEPAIAIGNALGYGQSVTLGVISAKDREVKTEEYTNKLIQTDAAINPGNSGGALLNIAGEVIGINSVKYSSTEVEGMGYAIPISDAMPIINELMNKETKTKVDEAKKSYMGISGVDITSDVAQAYNMPKGVYVAQVTKDSPADKAGLKKGDIITKIADVSVTSFDELKAELEYHEAGSTVKVDILTQSKNSYGYESKSVDVTLAKRED